MPPNRVTGSSKPYFFAIPTYPESSSYSVIGGGGSSVGLLDSIWIGQRFPIPIKYKPESEYDDENFKALEGLEDEMDSRG